MKILWYETGLAMIVSCPRCTTRYDVPIDTLGEGRVVRCTRCRHEWLEKPRPPEPPPPMIPEPVVQPEPVDVAEADPVDGDDAGSATIVSTAMEMAYMGESEETPPEPEAEPEPEPEPEPDIENIVSEEPAEPAAEDQTSDGLFADEGLPRRLVRRTPVIDDEEKTPPPPARKVFTLWVIMCVFVSLVLAVLFMGMGFVLKTFPQARGFYEMIGYVFEQPLDGLEISDVISTKALEGGSRVLVVQGKVANRAFKPKKVPPLRAALLDQKGLRIIEWTINVEQQMLDPKQETSFREVLIDPDKDATRVVVAFEGITPPANDVRSGHDQPASSGSAAKDHARHDRGAPAHQGH